MLNRGDVDQPDKDSIAAALRPVEYVVIEAQFDGVPIDQCHDARWRQVIVERHIRNPRGCNHWSAGTLQEQSITGGNTTIRRGAHPQKPRLDGLDTPQNAAQVRFAQNGEMGRHATFTGSVAS